MPSFGVTVTAPSRYPRVSVVSEPV